MFKPRIFLTIVLSVILCGAIGFAAEEQENAVPEPPQKTVTAIAVKGNKSVSTNTIVSKMKTRIGAPYQDAIVSEDLKRLYALGYFSDIKMETEDYKDGLKLTVLVAERPIIAKIQFFGLDRITMKDEKLKELLKSKEGQYIDYPKIVEDVGIISGMYEKMGFSDAAITYNVEADSTTGKVNVQFSANEGKKVRIHSIAINGNRAFSDARVLKLLKTKRAWFFNAGVYKEEVLKEDVERIKSFYRKAGYTDVEVDSQVQPDPKKPYLLYITITIREGKKYMVGNVTITGNKEILEKQILAAIKQCPPGAVFSEEGLKYDVAAVQGVYYDRGYIDAQVQDTTSLNSANGRVDITYNIKENEVCYVDKIKIRGNIKTRDIVIRRELRIYPGDRFDGEKLRRSRERLENLGFFEAGGISYDTEPTDSPDKKNLIVDVKETKTGTFSFGGGYSTVDKLIGFVEVDQKNFDWRNFPYFTGAGQDLKLRASIGSISHEFDLSFTEPWLFDYPVSFGFDGYNTNHKRSTDVGYGYDEEVTGGDLRLGKELSEFLRADLMYRVDVINITNISDDASNELNKEYGENTISSLQLSTTYDSRNNRFDVQKGDVLNAVFNVAGGPFGGTKDFYKFYGRASHYFSLPKRSTLEFRGRVGIGDSYGDSSELPIYERYFAGGSNTIRGYKERVVGPLDSSSGDPLGGNSMVIGNIEYLYPVFDFLKIAAFFDTGNVWAKANKIGSGGFKSGYGIGVRIKTPIGPITVDYGIPLNKLTNEEEKSNGELYFSATQGF